MAKHTPTPAPTAPAAPVAPTAASDGTVTVDYGKAGKLTGCLVLNSVPGQPHLAIAGQQYSVLVPLDEGGYSALSVDGAYVK